MRAAGVFAAVVFFWVALSALRDDARFAALQAAQAHDVVATVQGKDAAWWSRRAVQARRDANKRGRTIRRLKRALVLRYAPLTTGQRAAVICLVFGPYCAQAVSVAQCESGLSIHARNGQYLGVFQMGSRERELYGHGADVFSQASAAHRYFVASGRDWSPWTCQP